MANIALDDKLSDKVMGLFHERNADGELFFYGEAMLVLEYAWHQYNDARKSHKNAYQLEPLQGSLVKLQKELMPEEPYLDFPHLKVERVEKNCEELYTRLQRLLDPLKTPVNHKYHTVDLVLRSLNAGFADSHPGANPFIVRLSGHDRYTGR